MNIMIDILHFEQVALVEALEKEGAIQWLGFKSMGPGRRRHHSDIGVLAGELPDRVHGVP